MVPEDTVPTNIYTSSYLSHRTVQNITQMFPESCSKQNSRTDIGDQ